MLSTAGDCKRKALGALLLAALLSMPPFRLVWADGENPATQKLELPDRTHFAEQDRDLAHRLAVGLGSVVFIALTGAAAVLLARRYGAVRGLLGQSSGTAIKVLAVRRVTARLTVATIQISEGRAIIVADNGHAICTLGEIPVPSTDGASR